MPQLSTAHGSLDYLVAGSGAPVTVFAHGLAGSIAETRPFGSGVTGTRAFFHFSGHGRSGSSQPWSYAVLASELAAVADAVGATRALGVSLGAGALTLLAASQPERFDRLVFVLPSVLDRQRTGRAAGRLTELEDLAGTGDEDGAARLLLDEQPPELRDRADVQAWVRRQAGALVAGEVNRWLGLIARSVPLHDRALLSSVRAPALVIGQEQDDAHPAQVAADLASALPTARLVVLPPGGVMWQHRRRVRDLVSGFLNGLPTAR
jgi:pimeloyl-ACP methyl ester carboxylesterase